MNTSRNRVFILLAFIAVIMAAWWLLIRQPSTPKSSQPAPTQTQKPQHRDDPAPRPALSIAAAVSAPHPQKTITPGVIASASWGSGKNQLGREAPEEANPEGPMSFHMQSDGSLVVLDQVNNRLVRYDNEGTRLNDTNINMTYPQDIAVGANGTTAILDRLKDQNVTLMDRDGKVVGTLPLDGEGIGETGGITGVFVDGDDVYVEREHGPLVKVGTVDGQPAEEQEELPGRPSRDGTLLLTAGIVEPMAGRIFVSAIDRAEREHRFTREILLDDAVIYLVLLDTDKLGTIYVAAVIGTPELSQSVRVQLVCMEPMQGTPTGGAFMPSSSLPDETFRDFAVLDEGGVVYAERTEEGIVYRIYHCS